MRVLKSNDSLAFRRGVVDAMSRLTTADDWDIIELAAGLVRAAKAPLDDVRAALEAELSENADFLAKSAIRQIEARNKRRSRRRLLAGAPPGFLDCELLAARCDGNLRRGTPEFIARTSTSRCDRDGAARTDEARERPPRWLRCAKATRPISYNVSPETCIDAMLFEVKVLYGSSRAH